jgi:hypothetical protein
MQEEGDEVFLLRRGELDTGDEVEELDGVAEGQQPAVVQGSDTGVSAAR